WSSDVCSSDLCSGTVPRGAHGPVIIRLLLVSQRIIGVGTDCDDAPPGISLPGLLHDVPLYLRGNDRQGVPAIDCRIIPHRIKSVRLGAIGGPNGQTLCRLMLVTEHDGLVNPPAQKCKERAGFSRGFRGHKLDCYGLLLG